MELAKVKEQQLVDKQELKKLRDQQKVERMELAKLKERFVEYQSPSVGSIQVKFQNLSFHTFKYLEFT